jgi:hypothetical protein
MQLLMGVFSYLYAANFVRRRTNLSDVLSLVMGLGLKEQLEVYQTLQHRLRQEGLVQ